MEMSADNDYVNHVICGIGVNINLAPVGSEPGLNAASLNEKSGVNVSRAAFARALYSSVEKWYKVF
jgi:biotin-(acetyl-CoA carboxylase) ligase